MQITPTVESLSKELEGQAAFFFVDIDEANELTDKFQVSSVPHFFFIKGGEVVGDYHGSTEAELEQKVRALVA